MSAGSRLAAILFADIVGYSDLSSRDEARALRLVRVFERAARRVVSRFDGRIVKFMGDGVMAEFSSTRAAIEAAVALRHAFARGAKAKSIPDAALRLGIHVGDVVPSGGDILGDGVNTAARLHQAAEPGEILVSDAVYMQLRQLKELDFEPRAERELKGVGKVRIYAVSSTAPVEPEPEESRPPRWSPSRRTLVLAGGVALAVGIALAGLLSRTFDPDQVDRSIAVLPFETVGRGGDPTFAEGIHGDILTQLSTMPDLDVISRTSVMRYRTVDEPLEKIARELGVAWVLQGEVQRVGDQVQVNARLVDARKDKQVWADGYRANLTAENLFEIQHEITLQIATALEVHLTREERAAIETVPTGDLEAYRLYVQGRGFVDQRTPDALRRSVEYFEQAIERDPDYALAWAGLAEALGLLEFYGLPIPASVDDPLRAARRAVEIDPGLGEAHASLGIILSLRHRGPEAVAELKRAIELQPAYAEAYIWLSWVELVLGRPADALRWGRRAAELNPLSPAIHVYLAEALLARGETQHALDEARRSREMQPEYGLPAFVEGLALQQLGRPGEAISVYSQALRLVPPEGAPSHAEINAALAISHVATGDVRATREFLDRIDEASHPFSAGLVHAALGRRDEAFALFEQVREWDSPATEIARYYSPDVLGPLRADPRYGRLLRRIDEAWGLGTGRD